MSIFGSREVVPIPGMSDLDYWTNALRKAERELDAATTRTALNTAAKNLMGCQ
jgi:hypothetical protein